MKSTIIPVFIFVIILEMKGILVRKSLAWWKSLAFSKKCKNMSTKQEIISDATFKAWPVSSNFKFACKNGSVTKATCYSPLAISPTITNCCKEQHIKCGRVPKSIFENVTMDENWSAFMWKPVFFSYYFEMLPPLLKVIVLFCYFLQYDEVFLLSLLDGCYQ